MLFGDLTESSWIDTSFDVPAYDSSVVTDLAIHGQDTADAGVNDGWTGFFKTTASALLDYSIKKDAAQTGVALMQQRQPGAGPMPGYAPGSGARAAAPLSPVVLLAVLGVLALVLTK